MSAYLGLWKMQKNNKNKKKRKKIMMEAEMECAQLQQDALEVQQKNREEAEAVRSIRQKKTPKLIMKFTKRLLAAGWAGWRKGVDLQRRKGDTAELILEKVRKRYVA